MNEIILEIDGIYKGYKEKNILKEITFNIKKGEILGIIGKSGAGKTTLLKLLVGYLKPDQGLVFFNGENITKNLRKLRSEIGFVTQDDCFYDELTVNENLHYFGKMYNVPYKNILLNSKRILKFLKLNDLLPTLKCGVSC